MRDVSKRQLLRKSSVVFFKPLLQPSNIARPRGAAAERLPNRN
jgi:hypothetical protein